MEMPRPTTATDKRGAAKRALSPMETAAIAKRQTTSLATGTGAQRYQRGTAPNDYFAALREGGVPSAPTGPQARPGQRPGETQSQYLMRTSGYTVGPRGTMTIGGGQQAWDRMEGGSGFPGMKGVSEAGHGDLQRIQDAKGTNRGIIDAGIQNIEDVTRRTLDPIRDRLPSIGDDEAEWDYNRERVEGAFDDASDWAKMMDARTQEQMGDLQQEARDMKTEGLEAFDDAWKYAMDSSIRGMSADYQNQLRQIDSQLASGQISGQGGGSAEEAASAMKAQIKMQHRDRLDGQAAKLRASQIHEETAYRMQMDNLVANATTQQFNIGTRAGETTAKVLAGLAAAEAQAMPVFMHYERSSKIAAAQLETELAKMEIGNATLAAEMRMTSQYMEEPLAVYGLYKELFDMADLANSGGASGGIGSRGLGFSMTQRQTLPGKFTYNGQAGRQQGTGGESRGRGGSGPGPGEFTGANPNPTYHTTPATPAPTPAEMPGGWD